VHKSLVHKSLVHKSLVHKSLVHKSLVPCQCRALPTGLTAEIYAVFPIDATTALYDHLR
jgi:hypothetical protein